MRKRKFLAGILTAALVIGLVPQAFQTARAAERQVTETVLEKSTQGNPVAGFDENGDLTYAGDPAILVDGDTVYLYVGHDFAASGAAYTMPNYLCYSTKDLKTWNYEGVTMEMTDVKWADNVSAWASQVIKYQGIYYLLYCAERTSANGGGKAVAVAVSDSPTGPFEDQGVLIAPNMTNPRTCALEDGSTPYDKYNLKEKAHSESFGWEDIDPTGWIATDENGEEHFYMAWGNTYCWMCELTVDLDGKVVVVDQNSDGEITQGWGNDIWYQEIAGMERIAANGNTSDMVDFTEAPYLYRRQDENGNYYGNYYLFFATHWREEMGYAISDTEDITGSQWTFQNVIMEPTATSDTNHPAVFDFKGHTYFIYHNGSLAGGMGQRRVVCIEELFFNDDGTIQYIQETSTGLTGVSSKITDSTGANVAHEKFNNTRMDADYAITGTKSKKVLTSASAEKADMLWEIEEGKADKANQAYVTIESYNKPGLYLTAYGYDKEADTYGVVLAHDHNNNSAATAEGITDESKSMTFRTLEGFAGKGVTFESVAYPGYYVASRGGSLILTKDPSDAEATFEVSRGVDIASIRAEKTKRDYKIGETVTDSDIRVWVTYGDGTQALTKDFKADLSKVDTKTAGKKTLTVTYKEENVEKTCDVTIDVYDPSKLTLGNLDTCKVAPIPKVGSVHTIGGVKYQVTKSDPYNTNGTNGTVKVTAGKKAPATVKIGIYVFKVTK